jgi:peptidoglycan-associated lipoprotein
MLNRPMLNRLMLNKMRSATLWSMVIAAAVGAGCGTKHPIPPPPPSSVVTTTTSQGSGKPQTEFAAEPTTIDRGGSALLRWNVTGANYISIDTFGAVQASGSRSVTPYATTTYHLIADGPSGRSTAEATVTVNPGNPPPPPNSGSATTTTTSNLSLPDRLAQQVQDAFFAYDQYAVEADAQTTLTKDAAAIKSILTDFPTASLIIEGHCDERGSAEYNIGLGDRRATSAKEFLVQLGVPADKLRTVSYGKERPQCMEQTEDCWARNRRAHITAAQ